MPEESQESRCQVIMLRLRDNPTEDSRRAAIVLRLHLRTLAALTPETRLQAQERLNSALVRGIVHADPAFGSALRKVLYPTGGDK